VSRTAFAAVAVAAAGLASAGCGGVAAHPTAPAAPAAPAPGAIKLTSTFAPGGTIPRSYTCDGHDASPPLRAHGVPAHTVELLLVMRDPDAPGGDFIHWAIANIKPAVVASGGPGSVVFEGGRNPAGAVLGRNSFGSLGYRGPCPPPGEPPHHYEITLSALGQPSNLRTGFSPTATQTRTQDILAQGTLTGVYARH
jgi:Raf kinase inhibitor-like YbhB/YbcL family protein